MTDPAKIAAIAEGLSEAQRLIGSEASTCYESSEEARLSNLEKSVSIICLAVRNYLKEQDDEPS